MSEEITKPQPLGYYAKRNIAIAFSMNKEEITKPQPLGYYGLEVSPLIESKINMLDLTDLQCLFSDISFDFWMGSFVADENEFEEWLEDLTAIEKIALIRGLCDRIELKLMEQAK